MKLLLGIAALFIVIVIGNTVIVAQPSKNSSSEPMKPPIAKKMPKVLKIHGYEITDNYAWLRDRSDKKDPEVIKYLEDNNKYTETFMGQYQGFVDNLYKEMLGRIKQTDLSVPYNRGDYWYFNKTEEGKQYPTYLRSKAKDGVNPEVLLDQNEMAKGYKYFAFGDTEVSDDGNLLAYTTDTTGYRQYTLHVKDLRTGKTLDDKVERVTSLAWSNDGKYLFIGQEDPVSKRSDKIWRHEVGTDKNDLIYEEKDVLFNVGVGKSRDHKMLFIASGAKTMDEYRYLAADNPTGEWKVISPRREGHQYNADFDSGEFYFVTNKDAENFKVMRAPASDPTEKSWVDFFIHQRLQPQLDIAINKQLIQARQLTTFESLYKNLPSIFSVEPSALLHGDLWNGNFICDEMQRPVLIDPAIYYGHRAIDLGMTTLFGGFDNIFYNAYFYHSSLPENYKTQWEVCNLYPLLIHLNLFGSSYYSQVMTIAKKYC